MTQESGEARRLDSPLRHLRRLEPRFRHQDLLERRAAIDRDRTPITFRSRSGLAFRSNSGSGTPQRGSTRRSFTPSGSTIGRSRRARPACSRAHRAPPTCSRRPPANARRKNRTPSSPGGAARSTRLRRSCANDWPSSKRKKPESKQRSTVAHVMHERSEPAMAHLLFRGEYDKRRDPVKAGYSRRSSGDAARASQEPAWASRNGWSAPKTR